MIKYNNIKIDVQKLYTFSRENKRIKEFIDYLKKYNFFNGDKPI